MTASSTSRVRGLSPAGVRTVTGAAAAIMLLLTSCSGQSPGEYDENLLFTAPFGRDLREAAATREDRLLPRGLGVIADAGRAANDLISSVPGVVDPSVFYMDVKDGRLSPTSRVCVVYQGDELSEAKVDSVAADLAAIYRTTPQQIRVTPLVIAGEGADAVITCPPLT